MKRFFAALFLVLWSSTAFAVSMLVTWNASTDPDSAVAGYHIWRNGVLVGTSTTTSFLDTGLTPSTQYCYTISAFDPAGNESIVSNPPICATTLAGTLQTPGPSSALYNNHPYYTCSTNRYAAVNGLSTNDGLTVNTPWDAQTAAGASVSAGTCINFATGVYNVGELDFQHGGTDASNTGYVVWRCASMPFSFSNGVLQGEGSGCVLKPDSTNNFILRVRVGVQYVMVDGFEFDGTGMGASSSGCFDTTNGPQNTNVNHHAWVLNSDAHHCGTAGIGWIGSDWLFVIHNVWHDNSTLDCVMGSGLSIWEPQGLANYTPTVGNSDYWHSNTTNLTYHFVIAYNVGYHNYNPQGACGATANTDGNGLILDSWDDGAMSGTLCPSPPGNALCPYPFATLVMGNIMYNNGGAGIHSPFDHATAVAPKTYVNNTMYSNNWDTFNAGAWRPEASSAFARNQHWINNIAVNTHAGHNTFLGESAPNGGACPLNNSWANNLSAPASETLFDGGNCNTYPTPTNVDTASAGFTTASTTNPNFGLAAGSAALGIGTAFDLWQQSGTVDAGACPNSSPGPTTNCP